VRQGLRRLFPSQEGLATVVLLGAFFVIVVLTGDPPRPRRARRRSDTTMSFSLPDQAAPRTSGTAIVTTRATRRLTVNGDVR